MNCKVGDRVRFLNDVGGGVVTRVVKSTVYVLSEDDFEIPVLMSEVIVTNQVTDSIISDKSGRSEAKEFGDQPINVKEEVRSISNELILDDLNELDFLQQDKDVDPEGEMLGIFLAFVPCNQANIVESNQELYIINDSPYRIFYSISRWIENRISPLKAGFLYSDSKELVVTFERESLNADVTLNIQYILFKNIDFVPQQPEFYDLRLNSSKFFREGSFAENDFFDDRALIYSIADTKKDELIKTLTSSSINKVIEQKDSKPKIIDKPNPPDVEEVDLHIHVLVENPNEFTPGQIIEMQLARFKVALEGAIKAKTKKMVFIHGVGNGKLKHELRRELDKKYPNLRYQDASFREYGYGATMVFFKGK